MNNKNNIGCDRCGKEIDGLKNVKKETEKKQEPKINNYIPKRYQKKERESNIHDIPDDAPKIKNSKLRTQKKSDYSMTLEEKQVLLRILMKNYGLTFDEAKLRIKNILDKQQEIRMKMREDEKSEEEIESKQKEMIIELWKN